MTHLKIEQNTGTIEQVDSIVISKLYDFVESNLLDQSSNLQGRLHTTATYQKFIDGIQNKYPQLYISSDKYYLYLGDPVFTSIIATAFGDGYGCVLSDIQSVRSTIEDAWGARYFNGNTQLVDATGLKYFTNLNWDRSHWNYWHGFRDCTNLERVELPEGLPRLSSGNGASNYGMFKGCSSLYYVKLPSTITLIDTCCFSGCSSLTEIELPSSLITLGSQSFVDCGLTSIQLPDGLQTLGESVFRGTQLQSIHFPSSVKLIGPTSFEGAPISSITFDQSEGESLTWNSTNIYSSGIIASMETPNNLLTTLDFPARTVSFGKHPFRGLSALNTLIFRGTTPPTIGSNDFGFAKTPTIYVPDSAVSTYQATSPYSNYTIHPISELFS